MGPIILFDIIHKSHCTISANFYLYLQYFQQQNKRISNRPLDYHYSNTNTITFLIQQILKKKKKSSLPQCLRDSQVLNNLN